MQEGDSSSGASSLAVGSGRSHCRDNQCSHPNRIEQGLAPLRSFIDEQMIDNILVVLRRELARVDAGRAPSDSEVAEFLLEAEPSDLLCLIRTHPMMRGLESLMTSERRVLRWCVMLSRTLKVHCAPPVDSDLAIRWGLTRYLWGNADSLHRL